MRKKVKSIVCISLLLLLFSNSAQAQMDTLQANRYVTHATMYGAGTLNLFDTYLSPQEYKGIDFRISRESMQMTRLFDGNISAQNFFQADLGYTHNRIDNNNTFSVLVNWNYGLHYQFRITNNFKLLAGLLGDFNVGFVYNLHNSNNPASARAYINLAASSMAIWHLKIKRYPITLRYQVNLPVAGVMFSPHYGQSYYEIFTLGNNHDIIKFTSLRSQPSLRQMFSIDLPIHFTKIRFSYLADLQQSNLNNIKTHTYSHVFMVGVVKDLYRIRNKNGALLPPAVRAY